MTQTSPSTTLLLVLLLSLLAVVALGSTTPATTTTTGAANTTAAANTTTAPSNTTTAAGNSTVTNVTVTTNSTIAPNTTTTPSTSTTSPGNSTVTNVTLPANSTTPAANTTVTNATTVTTTPAPTTAVPIQCMNDTITLTSGTCFPNFASFPVQWCAPANVVAAQLATFKNNLTNELNNFTVAERFTHLNKSICPAIGGSIASEANVNSNLFCIGMQAKAVACNANIAAAGGAGCAIAVMNPSCGFCGRLLESECGVSATTTPLANFCKTNFTCDNNNGFASLQCRSAQFSAPACSVPSTVSVCAVSPTGAAHEVAQLAPQGQSVNSLQLWVNSTYCNLGGATVRSLQASNASAAFDASIACSELANSRGCNNAQCNNVLPASSSRSSSSLMSSGSLDDVFSPLSALADAFSTPICCDHCATFYTSSCNGGSPDQACAAKGCAKSNCWGNPITSTAAGTTPTSTPTPAPGGSNPLTGGAIAGIVIAVFVVVGAGGGFLYHKNKTAAKKDTALREYSSFPGGPA